MPVYRKNRFNEDIEVEKYTCGSCSHYDFDREDRNNKCDVHGGYYPMNDSCRNDWEDFDGSFSSGGCFLTTACCEYKDLPDDCFELTTLRKFRDNVMKESEVGRAMVDLYYNVAPGIVTKIKKDCDSNEILEWIYAKIKDVIQLIADNKHDEAICEYVLMMYRVEKMCE